MKKLLSLALVVALAALYMPAFADDSMEDMNTAVGSLTSRVNDLEKKGPSVEVHGFVQSDYINDSTQSFNETVGNGAVKAGGAAAGDNGFSQFSVRNSRISVGAKESASDWNFKGYIEADFLGANNTASEYKFYTQPTFRVRHAYVEGDTNDGWQILAGQYWTLFGWNMDYVLATVTEAPVMATLYERIPQLKIQKTFGDNTGAQLQVAANLEKPDQVISQTPNVDFGIRFLMNDIKGRFCSSTGGAKLQPLSIGLSERNAIYYWQAAGGDSLDHSVWGSAVAADVLIPVLPAAEGKDDPSLVLTAEGTFGAGDTMPFNGGGFGSIAAIGSFGGTPTYGAATGSTELDASEGAFVNGSLQLQQISSYNAQFQFFLPPSIGTIVGAGFGEIFSSNSGTLTASYNDDTNWYVNAMQDVSKSVRVGLEYAQFTTHYNSGAAPMDQRIQLSSWYRF